MQLDIMYSALTEKEGFGAYTDADVEENIRLFGILGIKGSRREAVGPLDPRRGVRQRADRMSDGGAASTEPSEVAPEVVLVRIAKTFDGARGPLAALAETTLSLEPGSVTALVGPSGCGKSTLLRIIAGLEVSDPGGQVTVGGSDPRSPAA